MENDCCPSISEAPRQVKDDVGAWQCQGKRFRVPFFRAPSVGEVFPGSCQTCLAGMVRYRNQSAKIRISEGLLYDWQVVGTLFRCFWSFGI